MAYYQLANTGSEIDTKLGYVTQDLSTTASPTFADGVTVQTDQNSATDIFVKNLTTDVAARASVGVISDGVNGFMQAYSTTYTTDDLKVADSLCVFSDIASNGVRLFTGNAASVIIGTNDTAAITVNSSQNTTFAGTISASCDSTFSKNQAGASTVEVSNISPSAGARAIFKSTAENGNIQMQSLGSGFVASGLRVANSSVIYSSSLVNGLRLFTNDAYSLILGTNNTQRVELNTTGGMIFQTDQNATTYTNITNLTDGTASRSSLQLISNNSQKMRASCYAESYTTSAFTTTADSVSIYSSGCANGMRIGTVDATSLYLGTNDTQTHEIDSNKNLLSNSATAETSSVGALTMKQGTDPTTSTADQISVFATSGANATLGLRTEASVAADTDETKFSHKLAVKINGTDYYIMLTQT